MSSNELQCPKCNGQMEEGFVMDRTYGGVEPSTWIEGAPSRSIWTGVKIKDKQGFSVATFRCVTCGYLESYARPD
jgi:hypothetical protein